MADNPATAQQTAEQIESQADFGRELTALRERAGLRIRDVGRLSGIPVSTVGDYFSGRHLPADRQQLIRILEVCGETDPVRIAWWEAALQRVRRLPGRRTGTPYRGLARFEQQDARWFFGREDVTEHLVSLAAESTALPLVLVGPSGAGKSSLLRAGLLPRLSELAAVAPEIAGPVIVLEPTATPVADLKARLTELAASPDGAEGGRPAVIVDQFEAVFTRCRDEAQRRDFITELCELAGTALVILALRADFYDQAIRYPGLASALQSRQVVLSPMTADQVRRAIIEPARLAKVAVEDGLVGLLLADLAPRGAGAADGAEPGGPGGPDAPDAPGGPGGAYERGALPLLSHAMLATWERSRGRTLAIADYLASGGIRDALTQTAERAYGSLTPDQQRLARRLFLRLVHVADDLPPSRATVELGELRDWGGDAEAVLATFVDERMITVDAGTAQLTHDALLTAWPRLRSWIEGGRDGLRTRRRITEGARAWADAGRESAALWRGSQLAVARDWAADEDNRASLPTLAAEFVAASIAEDSAARRAQRRRTRRLQGVIAMLTALVLAVAVLTAYAFRQRQTAADARDAAIAASQSANSREAAIEAGQLRAQDPSLAAQLSVAAYGVAHTPQATAALLESSGEPSAARVVDSPGVVQSVSVSPARRLLAAAGADGTLRLWNVAVPGHPSPVATLVQANGQDPLYTAAFSPDGKTLAAAGAGRVVQLWNVADPAHPVPVRPAADRAVEHDLLGRVQPRRQDPRRRQRRQDRPAVERGRPRARRAARPAANRSGRLRRVSRVQSRRHDARRRQRRQDRLAVGRGQPRRAVPVLRHAADRPRGHRDRGGVQPRRAHPRRREPGRQGVAVDPRGRHADSQPGRHADRGHGLGQHGRVQPGRHVHRRGHVRRRGAHLEPCQPEPHRDAAASAAGHLDRLGRSRTARVR